MGLYCGPLFRDTKFRNGRHLPKNLLHVSPNRSSEEFLKQSLVSPYEDPTSYYNLGAEPLSPKSYLQSPHMCDAPRVVFGKLPKPLPERTLAALATSWLSRGGPLKLLAFMGFEDYKIYTGNKMGLFPY